MPNIQRPKIAIATNLRRLCSFYVSVAEVSRKLGINRQQFNKYLSGASFPSLRNLRRITDFFGVDEFELLLPPAEFEAKVLPKARDIPRSLIGLPEAPQSSSSHQSSLVAYYGFYHVYFYTPVWSSHIVRVLTEIYQADGRTSTRTIGRLREVGTSMQRGPVQKFRGNVTLDADRLCVLEREIPVGSYASMTFLYPSHRRALKLLTGLMVGVASGGSRQPFASRVVYEFIGKEIDRRAALSACGLFSSEDRRIAEEIRLRINNTITPAESVLLPRAY